MRRHLDKWMILFGILAAGWGVQTIAQIGGSGNKYPMVSATDRVLGRQSAGAGVVEEIVCTSFARTILDDTTAGAVRTTIGAGTGSGTVTDVTGTSPIASTGGATPAISLNDTAVTPGSYTYSALTVDAKGRLTAASSGTTPYVPGGTDVAVADGGTGASTHTDNAVVLGNAAAAFAYATIGTAGRVLTDQGAGADPAFTALGGIVRSTTAAGLISVYDPQACAFGATILAATMERAAATSTAISPADGVLLLCPIWLEAGMTVTSLSFGTVATAVGTPANWWVALYSGPAAAPVLLSQSADQTTTAWAANTIKTLALGSPQAISTTGIYYVGLMINATTMPTMIGRALTTALFAVVGNGDSTAALTTTAPNPAAAVSDNSDFLWCEVR